MGRLTSSDKSVSVTDRSAETSRLRCTTREPPNLPRSNTKNVLEMKNKPTKKCLALGRTPLMVTELQALCTIPDCLPVFRHNATKPAKYSVTAAVEGGGEVAAAVEGGGEADKRRAAKGNIVVAAAVKGGGEVDDSRTA